MNRASPRLLRPQAWPIRWWFPILLAAVVGATLLAIGLVLQSQIEVALVRVAFDALRNDTQAVVLREVGPVSDQPIKLEEQRTRQTPATATAVASAPLRTPARAFDLARAAGAIREGLADRDTAIIVYGMDGAIVEQTDPADEPIQPGTALPRALAGLETQDIPYRGDN